MTKLTKPQQTFVARLAIVSLVGAYKIPAGRWAGLTLAGLLEGDYDLIGKVEPATLVKTDGVDEDFLAAYALAQEDLEAARVVMEEQAAFGHLLKEMQEAHPTTARAQLQKAVRSLVADAETRERAAEASGVYQLLGFVEDE